MATDSYKEYKTFDQLLSDVLVDFRSYALENLIEPQELIRVVKRVNLDLGLRLHTTHHATLQLRHKKCKLPEDFYKFNFGLMFASKSITVPRITGTHLEQVPFIPKYREIPPGVDVCTDGTTCGSCNNCSTCSDTNLGTNYNSLVPLNVPCTSPRVFVDCKNDVFELIQIVTTEVRHWKKLVPVQLINAPAEHFGHCPNYHIQSDNKIWFKDGFVHSNVDDMVLYLNYEGSLVDDGGNLLLLSREDVCEYYEYALKERILENLFISGEDVAARLQLIQGKLRKARIEAKNVVNTPDFEEIRNTHKANREAFNRRYVDMFLSSGWLNLPYNVFVNGTRAGY